MTYTPVDDLDEEVSESMNMRSSRGTKDPNTTTLQRVLNVTAAQGNHSRHTGRNRERIT